MWARNGAPNARNLAISVLGSIHDLYSEHQKGPKRNRGTAPGGCIWPYVNISSVWGGRGTISSHFLASRNILRGMRSNQLLSPRWGFGGSVGMRSSGLRHRLLTAAASRLCYQQLLWQHAHARYNCCRCNSACGKLTTPAMAAGLVNRQITIQELLKAAS
jgi:hypothetical protein